MRRRNSAGSLYSGMYDDDSDNDDKDRQPIAGMAKTPKMRGNCTEDQWYPLNLAAKDQCKINMPRACVEGDSPEALEDKADHFQRCIDARQTLMKTCFDGGDEGHKKQIDQLEDGRDNCRKMMDAVEEPATEKAPSTEKDGGKSFRELVSEGSRLFPPRNAIPIP